MFKQTSALQRASAHLQHTYFDVNNPEHIKAFQMLQFGGRQHPTLRFHVEQPHLDVRTMMMEKVCEAYVSNALETAHA